MGSVSHLFKRFHTPEVDDRAPSAHPHPQRFSRRSSGLAEFTRAISGQEGLWILDLGATSPVNINRLTGLGHKVYTEDLLAASHDSTLMIPGEDGALVFDVKRFLTENLAHRGPQFDAVLCWDVADYLPEPLVKPVIGRICSLTKRGGVLLAFFHTRDAGPDAPHFRYHLAGSDTLELQSTSARSGSGPAFRLERVFNNRHIENLFREFASLKFFLARDNVREVLVVR